MKYLKVFKESKDELKDYSKEPKDERWPRYINISDEELDLVNFPLNRIVVCFNSGSGDHSVYPYEEIVNLLSESHDTDQLKPSEIIDTFYEELELSGNSSDAIFFDGTQYKKIHWTR